MKPQTSFFLYSAWARDEWKKNDPDTPYPEVLTRIGTEWQTMDEDKKAYWKGRAKEDMLRYDREMVAYED